MASNAESGIESTGLSSQLYTDSAHLDLVTLTREQLNDMVRKSVSEAFMQALSTDKLDSLIKLPDSSRIGLSSTEGVEGRSSSKHVHRKEFYGMKWSPVQTFQEYVTTLTSMASHCDFNVRCSNVMCTQMVSYADNMVLDLLALSCEDLNMEELGDDADFGTLPEDSDLFESLVNDERQLDTEQNAVQIDQLLTENQREKLRALSIINETDVDSEGNFTGHNTGINWHNTDINPSVVEQELFDPHSLEDQEPPPELFNHCDESYVNGYQFLNLLSDEGKSNVTTEQLGENKNQSFMDKKICHTTAETSKHMESNTGKKTFKCHECGKCFALNKVLTEHMKIHTGEKPHVCGECGKCFCTRSQLSKHMKIHTGEKPYACNECGMCFIESSSLVRHIRTTKHTGKEPYKCSKCGKCYSDRKSLTQHLKTHREKTEKKPTECSECGKCFRTNWDLTRHMERIHTQEKLFLGSERGKCNNENSKSDLGSTESVKGRSESVHWNDLYSIINTDIKSFTVDQTVCDPTRLEDQEPPPELFNHCDESSVNDDQFLDLLSDERKSYVTTEQLGENNNQSFMHKKICHTTAETSKHMESNTGKKAFECSECGKSYAFRQVLTEHMKIHTGEKPHVCSECGKCFCKRGQLSRHMKIHTGEKQYACSECGKCFIESSTLMRHIRQRKHTGKELCKCSVCGKCYGDGNSLTQHLKTHRQKPENQPNECNECGKILCKSSDLTRHMRIHTGEKPFMCSKCGKCYNGSGQLYEHMRTHTDEKTYQCNECGKRFGYLRSLKKHMKAHLPLKTAHM